MEDDLDFEGGQVILGPSPYMYGMSHEGWSKMSEDKPIQDSENDGESTKQHIRAAKPRVKLIRVEQVWDNEKWKWKETKVGKPKRLKKKQSNCVFKLARRVGHGASNDWVVFVEGEAIREILRELVREDGGPSFRNTEALDLEVMRLVYYQRQSLTERLRRETSRAQSNDQLIFELEAALDLIAEYFADVDDEISSLPEGEMTFNLLWTLFPPRTLVGSIDRLGQLMIYRVKEVYYRKRLDGTQVFCMEVDYIDSDGEETGFVERRHLNIGEFRSSRPILELPYSPFHLQPRYETERMELLKRAEKLLRLQGRHLQEYRGHALSESGGKFNSHGRVMLDPVLFGEIRPNNSTLPDILKPLSELTDEQKLLLKPVLYGFSLGDKIWGSFAVSSLTDVVWNDDIINALVLPDEQKKFIRALVESHASSNFDDFVRSKGKGLVGLLTGPPGVGKTLTAEAVAEIAQRPLYTVTSGELGSSPGSVQGALDSLMELAEAWDAVVLLDEADVFLVQRDNTNLTRNAITSIFLRRLEYYQGILMLTTNRHTSFDPAFESRLHFFLKYPDLDSVARKSIWRNFISRSATSNNVHVEIGDEELNNLGELPLNGRQIKNIMNIAQTVAVSSTAPLTARIIHTALGFSNYVPE